jgi:membrane-bound lytic murein transglycosylase
MKDKTEFNLMTALALAIVLVLATASVYAEAPAPETEADAKRALLQRMYELRIRYERERAQRENEARANVRLATQSAAAGVDAPTVSALRAQTNNQLVRFEQQFRCLDVDVDNGGGNTVVICGDNAGDITGSNVSAGRDLVVPQGGQP